VILHLNKIWIFLHQSRFSLLWQPQPSITFLFGGTKSGKTHLLGQLLSEFRSLFDKNVKVVNFVLVYRFYQEYYSEYIKAVKSAFPKVRIHVFKELTPENVAELQNSRLWSVDGKDEYSIFILDDVASTITKDLNDFWEGRCHHENISKRLSVLFLA
jgi:hypothetical protein